MGKSRKMYVLRFKYTAGALLYLVYLLMWVLFRLNYFGVFGGALHGPKQSQHGEHSYEYAH